MTTPVRRGARRDRAGVAVLNALARVLLTRDYRDKVAVAIRTGIAATAAGIPPPPAHLQHRRDHPIRTHATSTAMLQVSHTRGTRSPAVPGAHPTTGDWTTRRPGAPSPP